MIISQPSENGYIVWIKYKKSKNELKVLLDKEGSKWTKNYQTGKKMQIYQSSEGEMETNRTLIANQLGSGSKGKVSGKKVTAWAHKRIFR